MINQYVVFHLFPVVNKEIRKETSSFYAFLRLEHPQSLRPENLKSVAMATVVPGYPPKPNQL